MDYPPFIWIYSNGRQVRFALKGVGREAFPYDCPARDKCPEAGVYVSDVGSWLHTEQQIYVDRLAHWDGLEESP